MDDPHPITSDPSTWPPEREWVQLFDPHPAWKKWFYGRNYGGHALDVQYEPDWPITHYTHWLPAPPAPEAK
jgi:hypothetical protein